MVIHNKVFGVYGPNVAAEQVISSIYVTTVAPQGLVSACMGDIGARFHEEIRNGSIMVVTQNFSCNSSREWAPRALKFSGVELVIAGSFARIFFRNAINIGFPITKCADICGFYRMGDELEADLSKGIIRSITQGTEIKGMVLPDFLLDIMTAGGLLNKPKAEMEGKQDEGSEDRIAQEDYIRSER